MGRRAGNGERLPPVSQSADRSPPSLNLNHTAAGRVVAVLGTQLDGDENHPLRNDGMLVSCHGPTRRRSDSDDVIGTTRQSLPATACGSKPVLTCGCFAILGWMVFSAYGVSLMPAGRASNIAFSIRNTRLKLTVWDDQDQASRQIISTKEALAGSSRIGPPVCRTGCR